MKYPLHAGHPGEPAASRHERPARRTSPDAVSIEDAETDVISLREALERLRAQGLVPGVGAIGAKNGPPPGPEVKGVMLVDDDPDSTSSRFDLRELTQQWKLCFDGEELGLEERAVPRGTTLAVARAEAAGSPANALPSMPVLVLEGRDDTGSVRLSDGRAASSSEEASSRAESAREPGRPVLGRGVVVLSFCAGFLSGVVAATVAVT